MGGAMDKVPPLQSNRPTYQIRSTCLRRSQQCLSAVAPSSIVGGQGVPRRSGKPEGPQRGGTAVGLGVKPQYSFNEYRNALGLGAKPHSNRLIVLRFYSHSMVLGGLEEMS